MDNKTPDVPEQIETERLVLRMPKPGDGKAVNAAIRASLKENWKAFYIMTNYQLTANG